MTEQSLDERPPLAMQEVARVALELSGERDLRALLARFIETVQRWAAPSAVVAAVREAQAETGWRVLPALSWGSVPLGVERTLVSLLEKSPECLERPTVLRPTDEVSGVRPRDNWVVPWWCEDESGLLLLRGVPRPSPANLGEALAVASAPVWPRLLGGPASRVQTLVHELGETAKRLQAEADRQLARLQASHGAEAAVTRERVEQLTREQAEQTERLAGLSADLRSAEAERLAAAERLLEERRAAGAAAEEMASLKAALAAAEARAFAAEEAATQARNAISESAQMGSALAVEHARERERAETASSRAEAAEARLRRAEQTLASAQATAGAAQEAALAAEQRALAAEETVQAAGRRAAAAELRAETAEQAARAAEQRTTAAEEKAAVAEEKAAAAEERAVRAEQRSGTGATLAAEQASLLARLEERDRAVEAAEARARAAEEALVHAQHQRLQALTTVQRQGDEAGGSGLREAVEARAAAEARAGEAEQALADARRDFAELRARNEQAETQARDAAARIEAALTGVRDVIASFHRAAFVPAGLRLHLEEIAARMQPPQPRPGASWLRIAILDRDLGGLEPLAASLEALGLDVRVANYPEELGLLLRTPAAREIGAAVCDVMAFRPEQNVAGLFRSWEKDRPGLPLFLSYDPESPVELERAKRVPTSLLAGQVPRPVVSARLVEILQLLARRQASKT